MSEGSGEREGRICGRVGGQRAEMGGGNEGRVEVKKDRRVTRREEGRLWKRGDG